MDFVHGPVLQKFGNWVCPMIEISYFKGPNRVDITFPSPDAGNRSSFQKFFYSF
jgi:hypothetical protein